MTSSLPSMTRPWPAAEVPGDRGVRWPLPGPPNLPPSPVSSGTSLAPHVGARTQNTAGTSDSNQIPTSVDKDPQDRHEALTGESKRGGIPETQQQAGRAGTWPRRPRPRPHPCGAVTSRSSAGGRAACPVSSAPAMKPRKGRWVTSMPPRHSHGHRPLPVSAARPGLDPPHCKSTGQGGGVRATCTPESRPPPKHATPTPPRAPSGAHMGPGRLAVPPPRESTLSPHVKPVHPTSTCVQGQRDTSGGDNDTQSTASTSET